MRRDSDPSWLREHFFLVERYAKCNIERVHGRGIDFVGDADWPHNKPQHERHSVFGIVHRLVFPYRLLFWCHCFWKRLINGRGCRSTRSDRCCNPHLHCNWIHSWCHRGHLLCRTESLESPASRRCKHDWINRLRIHGFSSHFYHLSLIPISVVQHLALNQTRGYNARFGRRLHPAAGGGLIHCCALYVYVRIASLNSVFRAAIRRGFLVALACC